MADEFKSQDIVVRYICSLKKKHQQDPETLELGSFI